MPGLVKPGDPLEQSVDVYRAHQVPMKSRTCELEYIYNELQGSVVTTNLNQVQLRKECSGRLRR